jgi:hypothetical protein
MIACRRAKHIAVDRQAITKACAQSTRMRPIPDNMPLPGSVGSCRVAHWLPCS